MQKDDNSISFGMGILFGVIAGVTAAVLYAPKSGKETRKEIGNVVTDLAQKYTPEIQNAKKQALSSIDIMRCKLEREYNKIADAIRAKQIAKAKAKEFIDYEVN